MKKLLCVLLSAIMTLSIMMALPTTAFATSYEQQLKDAGFSSYYISYLTELHKKYPNWQFKPVKTGMSWSSAVSGERSSHSNQLIEKSSSLSTAYYCKCSSCYKNGSYVVKEGPNWVSASENAVKYYMDPRNFMNEKGIWQFESTGYSTSQSKTGVEAILKNTWMANSLIKYLTTSQTSKTYNSTTKYSDAILTAAKNSGMSAYYLASKIVQEVGGSSPNAGGASGRQAPFQGIYNYYNIGASSGAMDGLAWAAGYMKTTKATTMYSSYSDGKVSGTKTSLSSGQYMTWRANSGNYYKVRLYTESGGRFIEGKTGYVLKSACRTTYFNYGRPWSNPYKSITNGAEYISSQFKTQNTNYLQKFNVSPSSPYKHSNEYMANVRAAYSESLTTYNAYKAADIVDKTHIFLIPVYSSMPSSPASATGSTSSSSSSSSSSTSSTSSSSTTSASSTYKVTGLTLKSRTKEELSFTWKKVSGAKKYYVYIKNVTKNKSYNKTVTGTSTTIKGLTPGNEYAVKVKAYVGSSYRTYSSYNTKHTLPGKVSGVKTVSQTSSKIQIKWNKYSGADGYYIYSYDSATKKTTKIKTITKGSTTSATFSNLKNSKMYYYYVSAYTVDTSTKTGAKSAKLSTYTKPAKVKLTELKNTSSKKIKVYWNKTGGSGYAIQYATKKDFSDKKIVYVSAPKSSSQTISKTITVPNSKKTYYVRVIAYKIVNNSKKYGYYSSALTIKSL